MNGACKGIFWLAPWGPVEGQKVKLYHLISTIKSISKIFQRYKTHQMGFSFCRLGYAPGVGLWGARGAKGVKKI